MTRPAKLVEKADLSAALAKPSEQAPAKAKAARLSRAPETFRRAELVGKFPHIRHLPAPNAKRRLDTDERRRILDAMLLD